MRQQLKINNIWVVLPQNFKVTIKRTNPLFNNEGDFSFPFNIDPSLNKPLLQSAADQHGRFSLRRLNGLPCEYWFDGQLMFRGYTEVKDSIQFKDTIQLNFNSGVRSITEQVKDMNAQDVSVERLQLGAACVGIRLHGMERFRTHTVTNVIRWGDLFGGGNIVDVKFDEPLCPHYDTGYIPAPKKNALYTLSDRINVTKDSREYPYCNTRVAIDLEDANRLLVLGTNRRDAAPCMYVLYWLKRLFKDLSISITNEFEDMEDMRRLAFFSTFPKYTTEEWTHVPINSNKYTDPNTGETDYYADWNAWKNVVPQHSNIGAPYSGKAVFFHANTILYANNTLSPGLTGENFLPFGAVTKKGTDDFVRAEAVENTYDADEIQFAFRYAFLSSEQYPDTKVQTILDDLHNIFGLRIIYDTVTNHARVLYIKDVFENAPVLPFPAEFRTDPIVTRTLNPGIIISYGKERADDSFSVAEAAYDYDMPANERMVVQQPFSQTLGMVFSSTDRKTYYDPKTGNAAVIAVDSESEEDNQGATVFEVGQWNDYRYAVNDEDKAKTYKPNFEPIVCNNVVAGAATVPSGSPLGNSNLVPFPGADQNSVSTENMYETVQTDSAELDEVTYGQFGIPIETAHDREVIKKWYKMSHAGKYSYLSGDPLGGPGYGLCPDRDNLNDQPLYKLSILLNYASNNGECCDMTKDDSPLQKWQDGQHYVLGFMRGAGNDSGIEYDSETYNDDGTRGWKSVVGTPTFTADSVDQFGNVFDYNGTDTGGIDQSERLSLKLDARKVKSYDEEGNATFYPIDEDLANRGVAVKMLSSFLHFETHHHKVTRKASVAVGFIMNIDWCAQYDMQQCVGFVNSIQFDLSENGVGESTIEQLVME